MGQDTRIQMNIQDKQTKVGKFDLELNYLSKLLFMIMLIFSILLAFFSPNFQGFLVTVMKYMLLLSTIIPVSLRVNLDFSKIYFSYKINQD